jgi:hypothetical protein
MLHPYIDHTTLLAAIAIFALVAVPLLVMAAAVLRTN